MTLPHIQPNREGEAPAEPRDQNASASPEPPSRAPQRRRPQHGVHNRLNVPTVVWLTVCTRNRVRALATPSVQTALHEIWSVATGSRVGHYMLMPDHLHLFAIPGEPAAEIGAWVTYWKSMLTRRVRPTWRWLAGYWDTRVRSRAHYNELCTYMEHNPVRHELAATPAEWRFRGEVFEIDW